MFFKYSILSLTDLTYSYNVSKIRGDEAFSKVLSIFSQSRCTFINDHVPKPTQVTGRRIQLASLSPALILVLATTAPASAPASGRAFITIPPTSANPLIIDPAFLPAFLISSSSDFFSSSLYFSSFSLLSTSFILLFSLSIKLSVSSNLPSFLILSSSDFFSSSLYFFSFSLLSTSFLSITSSSIVQSVTSFILETLHSFSSLFSSKTLKFFFLIHLLLYYNQNRIMILIFL